MIVVNSLHKSFVKLGMPFFPNHPPASFLMLISDALAHPPNRPNQILPLLPSETQPKTTPPRSPKSHRSSSRPILPIPFLPSRPRLQPKFLTGIREPSREVERTCGDGFDKEESEIGREDG